ncbi:LPXTG cell wall anchor domain-containing protein [Macrococcus sp. DPC7161]|uniref:LPXTG cell wall anchor domain-containing protein n=1 Tax=Macrococcus sp. DPC7161 TaxID=2507060 RepID=UPI0013E92861|nr:LPXTG cell wall anchor domain-containing protein [Macrococcus sp. DPC7161]
MKKIKTAMMTLPLLMMSLPTHAASKPLVIAFDDHKVHSFEIINHNKTEIYTTLDDGIRVLNIEDVNQIKVDDVTYDVTPTKVNHIHLKADNVKEVKKDNDSSVENSDVSHQDKKTHSITLDIVNEDYTPFQSLNVSNNTEDKSTEALTAEEKKAETTSVEEVDTNDEATDVLYLFKDGEFVQSAKIETAKVQFDDLEADGHYTVSQDVSGEDAKSVEVDTHVHFIMETLDTKHEITPITPSQEGKRTTIQRLYKPNSSTEDEADKDNKESTKKEIKSTHQKETNVKKPQVKVEKPNVSPLKSYSSKPVVTDPDDRVASSSSSNSDNASSGQPVETPSSESASSEELPSTGEAMKTLLPIAAIIALGSGLLLLFVTKRNNNNH